MLEVTCRCECPGTSAVNRYQGWWGLVAESPEVVAWQQVNCPSRIEFCIICHNCAKHVRNFHSQLRLVVPQLLCKWSIGVACAGARATYCVA